MWSITGTDIMLLQMPLFLRSSSTVFLPLHYGRFRFRRSGKPYLRKRKRGRSIKWYTRLFKRILSALVHTACVVHNPSQEMEINISSNTQPIAMGGRGSPSTFTPSGSMK